MAAILGMLTGIGAWIARDVLVAETPLVLGADLYAVAALAGAAIGRHLLGVSPTAATSMGAVLCFGFWVMVIKHGWRLPVARPPNLP
jgi:uncharacterized membrane protein YeiH